MKCLDKRRLKVKHQEASAVHERNVLAEVGISHVSIFVYLFTCHFRCIANSLPIWSMRFTTTKHCSWCWIWWKVSKLIRYHTLSWKHLHIFWSPRRRGLELSSQEKNQVQWNRGKFFVFSSQLMFCFSASLIYFNVGTILRCRDVYGACAHSFKADDLPRSEGLPEELSYRLFCHLQYYSRQTCFLTDKAMLESRI